MLAKALTNANLDFTPEVGRDKEPVLDALGRTCQVTDHAGELLVLVEHIQQLYAGVVAAFQRIEDSGIGIAPHLGGVIRISCPAAHTHHSPFKAIGKRAGLTVIPGFHNRLGDPLHQQNADFLIGGDLRIGGNVHLFHILLTGGQEGLQQSLVTQSAQIRAGTDTGILGAGMGVDGGEDDLLGVQTGSLVLDGITDAEQQLAADGSNVTADQDSLILTGIQRQRGSRQRFFHILGNTLCKLSCQRDFLFGSDAYLTPTNV